MKAKNRIAAFILTVMVMLAISANIFAAEPCRANIAARNGEFYEKSIDVTIDGQNYSGDVYLISNTAYVPLREFACYSDDPIITWDASESRADVRTDSLTLTVYADSYVIEANGRALYCEFGSFVRNGKLLVPLRALSSAFGYDCDYDRATDTIILSRKKAAIESGDSYYDSDELYWLSRIIYAEAGAESFDGKLAVGNVIRNRVLSGEFPNTIIDVIFDTQNGVQFSPVSNGTIYSEPDRDSILAAKLTIEGVEIAGDSLYFLNEELAESKWIVSNCRYVMTIGCHDFYT